MDNQAYKTTIKNGDDLLSYVGKEVGLSEWLVIDQNMIDHFGKLTQDEQWIHMDPERSARESPFKKTIAHGFLVISHATHFVESCLDISEFKLGVNYGFDRIRFTSPVLVDSQIRGRIVLISVEEIIEKNALKVKFGIDIEVKGSDKPAVIAEWIGMIFQ